jgi:hypothetical protein
VVAVAVGAAVCAGGGGSAGLALGGGSVVASVRSLAFSAFRFGSLASLSLGGGALVCSFRSPLAAARFAARWGASVCRAGAALWSVRVAGVGPASGLFLGARVAGLRSLLGAVAVVLGQPWPSSAGVFPQARYRRYA